MEAGETVDRATSADILWPAVVVGVGLAGTLDEVILQWPYLFTGTDRWSDETVRDLEINTLDNGLFHAATWILTVVGLVLLWRAARRPHPA